MCDIDVVVVDVDITVVVRISIDVLVRYRYALFEFGHVVQRWWRIGYISVQFDVEVFYVGVENDGKPHDAFIGPRPRFVDKAEFSFGGCVVVPRVWHLVGKGVQGVFCHLLKIVKFQRVGIPLDFTRVLLYFNKKEERVPRCGKRQLKRFTNEEFLCLRDDAPIGHHPIGALDNGHMAMDAVGGFATFAFGEFKMNPFLHRAVVSTCSNSDVVQQPLKVIALATRSHPCNKEFIAGEIVLIAIVGAEITQWDGGVLVNHNTGIVAVDTERVAFTNDDVHLNM